MIAKRRLRRRVATIVRSLPFFPQSIPNRLGDDDQLHGHALPEEILVYFPSAPDSLYQLLPWLPTLEILHRRHPVAVICQDSRVAAAVRQRTTMRVLTIARYGRLDDLLGRSDVKLALYVSHEPRNFECLRFASLIHVYLGHGDSDKGVSASNQLKAYDYAMVPGQAAVDRVARRLMNYDAAERCIVIGQPYAPPLVRGARADADDRCTVLYAPTWEGAQPSVAYSSLLSHGPGLVRSLLADPRFRVIFRPHPLSGVTSGDYAAAAKEIESAIAAASSAHPAVGHATIHADEEPIEASFDRADLLVTDVSAVATAWLPTDRPMLITMPASEQSTPADSGMVAALPRLAVEQLAGAAELLWAEHKGDSAAAARRELTGYYS
ncbi:MAG: CDP-glycerol glycerophosphotransferase family protein, partial [Actinomycetota bacterium]|nr:CDP-glycerol glycerophosphotransferase family protein [Actinomycetota bacterium]